MSPHSRALVALAGAAVLLCGTRFTPAASPLSTGAARLLEIANKNTPPEVAAARAQYEKLKQAHPADRRIDYLYAVALVNQHRYGEALPLVDRYLAGNAHDASAVRTRIWAALCDRQYAPALNDAVGLSRRFAKRADPAPTPELEETARFLGTVFGYLELARPGAVDEKLRIAARQQILSALGKEYLSPFDEGRRIVAERLTELNEKQQEKQARAAQTLDKQQEKVESAIEKDRREIASTTETIQDSVEQMRDAQRKLAVLNRQLASLEQDRARLQARMTAVQTDLSEIQEKVLRDSSRRPTVSLDTAARLSQLSVVLTGLTRQAVLMDEKLRALRIEATRLGVKGIKQRRTAAANAAAVRDVQRRVKARQNQFRRLEARRPARRVLTAPMQKLSTYLPFPFEDEKNRVLGWFE